MSYENKAAPAVGTNLPFDKVGGSDVPRSKVGFGREGQFRDVSEEAPLPVDVGDGLATEVGQEGLRLVLLELRATMTELLARQKAVYPLASAQQLAAGAGTAAVAGVYGGVYYWSASASAGSVDLQMLGADGTSWSTIATIAAGGAPREVGIGEGTTIRMHNPGSAAITVSGSLR